MLKALPPLITPDLLYVLASMGHGDDLVIADRNFPAASVAAETITGRVILFPGSNAPYLIDAILALFPLDDFVDAPISRMEVVGDPAAMLEVHREVAGLAEKHEGRPIQMAGLERHAFYAAARKAYAVAQCAEARPYGNFILKKGVLFDAAFSSSLLKMKNQESF